MRAKRIILVLMTVCMCAIAYAQTDTIRYVHPNGAYSNNGRSWETAKNRVQDAINDLHEYMLTYNLTSGSVYIAAGTYLPTESTESSGGSMLNTSFKIYAGIHVYGGFNPTTPESRPGLRIMANDKTCEENWSDPSGIGTTSGTEIASQWDLKHKTILTGNHSGSVVTFTFDSIRGRYNTTYPASSFHVVWFATNGKYDTSDDALKDHYKPLEHPASLDGCVISSGNASSRNTTLREHTAYGGGVYMVGNCSMRACIVERCYATLRGGGIYCDGGGDIEFCYIHTCQSAGVGVVEGYGGGVCIDQEGSIGHSQISCCAARCGGGLMISHINDEYPWAKRVEVAVLGAADTITSHYSPYTTACVINNNTANAEGGGIYLAEGGTVNHATVCGNNCSGPDVTYYGRRHGRTGGIYVRNCGMIFNSVFWGNRCDANNDIQFASVRQKTGAAATGFEIFAYHTAFMNHDISDWTGVTKEAVYSLDQRNMPVQGSTSNHPCFFHPTVVPTNWDSVNTTAGIYGAGVLMHMRPVDYPGPRIWHLTSYSGLDQKGVQWNEAVVGASPWLIHAHTDYGVVSNPYEPVSTLGALVRKPDALAYSLVVPQSVEYKQDQTPIPTLFVDPNRKGRFDEEGNFDPRNHEGDSWDAPIKDLGEALSFFRQFMEQEADGTHYFMIPARNPDTHLPTGELTRYDYVQILVKEGTLTTVGPGNYLNRNIRTAAIRMESHMRLYGGYPSSLEGTETAGRNPHEYKSFITANITGETGAAGYQNNSAHVIAMVNAEHSVVDGFTLQDANTHGIDLGVSYGAGGGLLLSNASIEKEKRIHMVYNQIRNCVIANCSAPKGAAIFVSGSDTLRRNGNDTICYAELMVINCVIRNNTTDFVARNGVIAARGRAYIHVEHCTVVNNVGYAFKADEDASNHFPGYLRVDNSIIFCNADRKVEDNTSLGDVAKVLCVYPEKQDYVFGKFNMFDADMQMHQTDVHQPHGFFANDYHVPKTDDFLPEGIKPFEWGGIEIRSYFSLDTMARRIFPDSLRRANQCIFTRTDMTESTFPTFVNPSRNVGHSETGDKPLYGGTIAYVPMTTNPCVNAAYDDAYTAFFDCDRSDVIKRNRGGAPDVGAIENTDLPEAGSVIYVTPDGAGKRDGSSWDNAIAGNTVYRWSGVAGPDIATGDWVDTIPTCDRVLDSGGNPILTTNEKYNGGWGRVWFAEKKTGATSTTTVTKTWTTEKNVYDDGPRVGEEEYIQTDAESESTNTVSTSGSTPEGFVAGYDFDPRYPYGEISGASRSFWRANPYHNGADWNNSASYNMTQFIEACNNNGWINNTRAERYVGGLQYAVEKASSLNKGYHKDSVQVWVGAGQYTDYKGFIMRDSVSVYGGFPVGKYPAPGMAERQALMSAVEDIPKSLPAKEFVESDYESVLQLSDVNPKNSDSTLNTAAVKYWDDDYTYTEQTQTTQHEYKTRTIVHHYTYNAEEQVGDDVQDSYMQYANMTKAGGGNVITTSSTSYSSGNDTVFVTFGTQSGDLDCWHVAYPNKTNYFVNVENNSNANGKTRKIYNPADSKQLPAPNATYTGNWIYLGNGSLEGLNLWQTMHNVPQGKYRVTFDLGGQYKNRIKKDDVLNIFVCVLDEEGSGISDTISLKSLSANKSTNREGAYRFSLDFELPSTEDAVFKLFIGDGVKNTTGTYGTPTGKDPDEIPCSYVWDGAGCTGNKWGSNNPNAREFWLSNIHIKPIVPAGTYELTSTDDDTVDNDAVPHEDDVIEETKSYTSKTHRTTLRKRVLTMPDVCVPTYGAGSVGNPTVTNRGKFSDGLSHTHRVFGPTKAKRTSWESSSYVKEDPNYIEYNEANWDGFTIRHGFISEENMAHGGGAGVNMYEGAHLRNCIVINNISSCGRVKGGGIFCDGSTSTIEGCFVLDNISMHGELNEAQDQNQIFAGGMFMYEGTCFNSLFANNYSYGSAGGLGFCVGRFFNNTVAYNTCNLKEDGQYSGGAISLAISSTPNLFVANTIIYGNNGIAIRDRNTDVKNVNPFLNCYIQSELAHPYDATNKNVTNWTPSSTGNYGTDNIYLNGVAPSAENTPFAADFVNGVYTPGNASATNDFQLISTAGCVNKGTEDFAGVFYTALRHKGKTDSQIKNSFVYKSVEQAVIPQNDVAFAKRIQDCQIDMGAYEYNAAYNIIPDTTTHPGHAIFYTTYIAPGGDASARSPENAACMQKLQLVLDAAGRYKNLLMTNSLYDKGYTTKAGKDSIHDFISQQPNKYWIVEVWLEGDSINSRTSNVYADQYTPTRSTRHSEATYQDNTLDYSFMVPHGVQLKGGFQDNFYHYEDAAGNTYDAPGEGRFVVDDRDPLTFRTVLSGHITSSTGAKGQTYHVVTFTNDLFSPDDEKIIGEGKQLETLTNERDRAVLDGLFLMDGKANAPDLEGQIGGACIVTDYAHVRNCVIQNNTAVSYGGGLYLKPQALVSGTIVKNNTANIGGGIYVEAPATSTKMNDSLAHVFYTTICENTGRSSAGGLFFDNTYARINSTAIWHNNANDNANVAGNFARSADTVPYPMNCCAVESRRLEGQGNIELSPRETEGVRWDRQDPFNAILYYPIEMSSTLARAGISYTEWNNYYTSFATLDSIDIAGVSRKRWTSDGSERGFAWGTDTLVTKNNDVIDIGARAINKDFEVHVDAKYVMHRLFVIHSELIDSKAARALQDNTNTDSISNMYRQMGSCIYNPFHRLDDAFEYVIKARKMDSTRYRNTRFEIFIEQGTYYPMRDAYLRQGSVRMNTFLIPEAVLVVGGIDSRPADHKYGQAGFKSPFSTVHHIGNGADVPIPGTGYTIKYEVTDSIRLRDARHRPMRDNNLNSVIEPWELERQTILSGNAVAGEDFTHVYHVITCHADNRYVGPRPIKYGSLNPAYNPLDPNTEQILTDPLPDKNPARWGEENDMSTLARTIGFDGIQITGGYANHVDPADTVDVFVTKTYFRGGGIYVDGNWNEDAGTNPPDMTQPALHNIPIVVENCFFTNNMAGNGGAIYSNGGIYAYGDHFTQNYSQGPMTKLDQRFIPWTAGGCIATNAFCGISNTLFDNNEARRGLFPLKATSADLIPNADARQGFGGCLSIADKSQTRVVNCHFMKNKAVAYSAMYNFYANNRYADPNDMQYAFNTIFWGNEVFEVDHLTELEKGTTEDGWDGEDDALLATSSGIFDTNYKASRAGVFHYDGDEWNTYERLFHEYDSIYNYWTSPERGVEQTPFHEDALKKLDTLRTQGNKMEGLYFCSYRKTYGPTGMKPTSEGYLLTPEEHAAWKDPRSRTVQTKVDATNDKVEDYTNLWTQVSGNNNTLINRINTATDGPNFKQPTFVAGIDGYMQNADWLQARMNLTTDQGWGFLKQNVTRGISYYITRYTEAEHFESAEKALAAAEAAHPGATMDDVFPVYGLPVASFLPKDEQTDTAMYNFLAWRYGRMMSESNAPLPLGDQYYMSYTRSTSDSETSGNMARISKHPKMGVNEVYIDLGIYEYQYVQLDIKGQEVDTVWVATKAKDPLKQDGLTWETPTTDLQAAIELLMSSHNNHDKYVCFLGNDEGETFSPQNVLDNRRAFVITSSSHSPMLPDSALADHDYGVNSLTFLGGYSFDVKNAKRDPQANPTVIEMPHAGNENQLNQLFIIEDMTRQMLQANFIGKYTTRDSVVIPIVFDGITFINPYSTKEPTDAGYSNLGGSMSKKGGAAIYYRWQRRYDESGPIISQALHPDSALIDGRKVTLPKLTISNCIFMDNGERTTNHLERSPAVRIDHGGGSSLIVNTLFHSNAGAPVYARTYDILEEENDLYTVPNDVVMVNITSALNDGHIRLEGTNSEVHNSLIWMDDLHNDTLIQLQMGASDQWDKTTNKNRVGIDGRMTHNAVWGCFQDHAADNDPGDAYQNHPLSSDNHDIFKGPGFLSPHVAATTSEQRRERNFRLNPSIRTMNMAGQDIYRDRVFFRVYPDTCAETHNKYWRRPDGFKSLTFTGVVAELANDSDLASKPRLSGDGMERGAYECLAVLQRVLYVRPELPAYSAGDGSNWEHAFGQGQLQNAIDAAAVYTYMRQDNPNKEDRKAYVFVKGTGSMTDHYDIEARDGVYVYGSVPGYFNDTAWIDETLDKFTNEECHRFINYVRASRSGVAAPNAPQTKINSIRITGDDFETGFLLDGFVITNPTHDLTISPVLIDNENAAVRNCLIIDNRITDPEQPIANVKHGLLYNCLFYNDSAGVMVKVGANGLVLNNTIVADNADITPLDDSEAAAGAVQNNIAGQLSSLTCFAPYMTTNNPYELPAYLTNNAQLAYQLHEHSTMLNTGTMDSALPALFDDYKADNTINFKWDRDVLGNPRKISSSVDMGALETWYIAKNQAQEITAITNRVPYTETDNTARDTAYTKHFGGHNYPHVGSVVYLMDSAALSMQYATAGDFKDFRDQDIIFNPGFMLIKPGASFYGNGHIAQIGYIAAEKRFKNQRYSMTAFPFNYSKANITITDYNNVAGTIQSQLSPLTFNTFQYNGAARSAKDYVFQTNNSSLWLPVDTLNRTATEGYLMDFTTTLTDTILRFNAFADAGNRFVYTEGEDANDDGYADDKYVYLTQHDHRTAGTGESLNFTSMENMGWNMKGLPWLVSNYRTDTILEVGNYLRQMHIPHVFYQMDGAGDYITEGDKIYTSRSWDRGAVVSMGNAFFTQTATPRDTETVIFHIPYYGMNEKASRPILRVVSHKPRNNAPAKNQKSAIINQQSTSDLLTFFPDSTASKTVGYSYGRDGIKWTSNDGSAQVYMLDSKRISHISLLGSAPTEVDIPIGVYAPEGELFTFSLPEKEAFAGYEYIWLIDYEQKRYTNLLDEDYEVSLEPGENNHRFAVRIGEFPKTDEKGKRSYVVYTYSSQLFIRGLIAGDKIDIYTPEGKHVYSDVASSTEWQMPLFYQTGYIVKVNDKPHKVLNL